MKSKKNILAHAALTIIAAIGIVSAFWYGFGLGISQPAKIEEKTVNVEPISEGVTMGEVYSTEIWDNGEVRVTSTIRYLNQLSEHTVLITDRSLDDVQQEIWDSMDVAR
jgi:hypothetical protein